MDNISSPFSVERKDKVLGMALKGLIRERYHILEEIGRGGFGVAYRAHDMKVDRDVVVKQLHEQWATGDANPKVRRLFETEWRSLARLSEHPNIVYLIDLLEDHNAFVMQWVGGGNLTDLIKSKGHLPLLQAVTLMSEVCDGLGAAHRLDIIHRDVKPSNILLTTEGHAKVSDFGIAHQPHIGEDRHMTISGSNLGTINFMSPEQARGDNRITPEADLYSVGTTLYAAVTGRYYLPFRVVKSDFDYETMAYNFRLVRDREPDRPRRYNPHISVGLETIIMKCLRKAISERYQSAEDLSLALHQVRTQLENERDRTYREAESALTVAKWGQALKLYERVLAIDESYAEAQNHAAMARKWLKPDDAAIEAEIEATISAFRPTRTVLPLKNITPAPIASPKSMRLEMPEPLPALPIRKDTASIRAILVKPNQKWYNHLPNLLILGILIVLSIGISFAIIAPFGGQVNKPTATIQAVVTTIPVVFSTATVKYSTATALPTATATPTLTASPSATALVNTPFPRPSFVELYTIETFPGGRPGPRKNVFYDNDTISLYGRLASSEVLSVTVEVYRLNSGIKDTSSFWSRDLPVTLNEAGERYIFFPNLPSDLGQHEVLIKYAGLEANLPEQILYTVSMLPPTATPTMIVVRPVYTPIIRPPTITPRMPTLISKDVPTATMPPATPTMVIPTITVASTSLPVTSTVIPATMTTEPSTTIVPPTLTTEPVTVAPPTPNEPTVTVPPTNVPLTPPISPQGLRIVPLGY